MRLFSLIAVLFFVGAAFAVGDSYSGWSGSSGSSGSSGLRSSLDITTGTVTPLGLTTPQNGDRNPYGVWIVPRTVGHLYQHNILVSNANAASNLQDTGSTIIQFWPNGTSEVFAQIAETDLPQGSLCPGGIGLTAALAVLERGWVVVGSFPAPDGTTATAQPGCIIILDPYGNPVSTLWGQDIRGPWGLTLLDRGSQASLFISNAFDVGLVNTSGVNLNRGSIVRIDLLVPEQNEKGLVPIELSRTVIGTGFGLESDPTTFVLGPTGLTLTEDLLFLLIADTVLNRIAAIPNPIYRRNSAYAGLDRTANGFLNQPLGLTTDPLTGDILAVNGGDGNLVQLDRTGSTQLAARSLTSNGAGVLFGLAIDDDTLYFTDDFVNSLNALSLV